jgi:hypothetical protein
VLLDAEFPGLAFQPWPGWSLTDDYHHDITPAVSENGEPLQRDIKAPVSNEDPREDHNVTIVPSVCSYGSINSILAQPAELGGVANQSPAIPRETNALQSSAGLARHH